MAAGDVISVITGTALSTWHYYQPSAGTEIVVTSAFAGLGTEQTLGLYDGVNRSPSRSGYSTSFAITGLNVKVGITNSVYLAQFSDTAPTSLSGIQIK